MEEGQCNHPTTLPSRETIEYQEDCGASSKGDAWVWHKEVPWFLRIPYFLLILLKNKLKNLQTI